MELEAYREYLRRAEDAGTVRELHQVAREAQLAYRNDPDAEAVERACWMHAERLIAAGRPGAPQHRRHHPARSPPPARAPAPGDPGPRGLRLQGRGRPRPPPPR